MRYDVPLGTAPLRPQDLVLTILGANVRGVRETAWSGGLVLLLEESGFSTASARVALTRLVNRGLLERERNGRLIHYRLTERCDQLLAEGDQRIFRLGSEQGDGAWTILWHDLPEDRALERGQLARRLRFLGFGSLQDGLWVSPVDRQAELASVLEQLQIGEHVAVLGGRPARGLETMIATAWDLPVLVERYRAFAKRFEPALADPPADEEAAFELRVRLTHLFRGFAVMDPGLPDSMLEGAEARRAAVSVFSRLYESLAPAAQRHFDSVAGAPPATE